MRKVYRNGKWMPNELKEPSSEKRNINQNCCSLETTKNIFSHETSKIGVKEKLIRLKGAFNFFWRYWKMDECVICTIEFTHWPRSLWLIIINILIEVFYFLSIMASVCKKKRILPDLWFVENKLIIISQINEELAKQITLRTSTAALFNNADKWNFISLFGHFCLNPNYH